MASNPLVNMAAGQLAVRRLSSPGRRRLAWFRKYQATIKPLRSIGGGVFYLVSIPKKELIARPNDGRLSEYDATRRCFYEVGESWQTVKEVIDHCMCLVN